MKVACEINYTTLEGDFGEVEGVEATCSRCGHTTESFGTNGASVRRCLVLMREECPNVETNFYVAEDE
jgi:tRNA(Ile2) C34 agmatinyltransferase TiaS